MAAPKFENLVEMFERSVQLYGARELFGTKRGSHWVWTTYGQVGKFVSYFRSGLASLGIQRGDRIAIIANNRVEWAVAAYACYGLGVALVPMYEAQHPKEWAFIVQDCEAVAIIASNDEIVQTCLEIQKTTPTLKHVIGLSIPKPAVAPAATSTEVQADKTQADKTQPDETQIDKTQADEAQSDEVQAAEVQAAEVQVNDSPPAQEAVASDGPLSYEGLLEAGKNNPVPSIKPDPTDVATLIYTSGTTGNPKGVILTHDNLASNITAVHNIFLLTTNDRSLSFLPWAHSFGHTCELHWFVSAGASMALNDAIDKIVQNLAEVHPSFLLSVPRIFNRIYGNVNKQMESKPPIIQNLFQAGLRAATKRNKGAKLSWRQSIALALADRLVFSKIRDRFGGNLRYAISGGAALSKEVAEFIDALGIIVFEGYGLTETSPIVSANYPGAHRIGSVGKPVPRVKVVIDKTETSDPKEGEIVVFGPNVMVGYHRRDDDNRAVFVDGETFSFPPGEKGFRTGDLGYIDDDGFLYITGRIKEQYKLENGKYVAPAPLEEQLKLCPLVLNVMVYGANRPYNVALVVTDVEALQKWAKSQGLSFDSTDQMLNDEKVKNYVLSEVHKVSSDFKGFEQIKKVSLVAEDFTTQNGLLTPKLSLKRRVAWEKFKPQFEAMYQGSDE